MNKNILKRSYKKSVIIILAAISCVGCNNVGGGGGNSASANSVTATTSSNNRSFLSDDNSNSAQRMVFSNDVRLGGGFDIDANVPRPLGTEAATYMNDLIDSSPESSGYSLGYTVEGQLYNSWATMDGSYADSARASKKAGTAAIGSGWGDYSISMKMAMEQSQERFNQGFSQTYDFGAKVGRELKFSISATGQNSPGELVRTRNSILNANNSIKQALDEIRSSSTPEDRAKLVAEFYADHGKYFVNSITQGYIGDETVTMTQSESSGQNASGASIEGEFSSPYVNGAASYSQASSSAFKKANWDIAMRTSLYPLSAQLSALMDGINSSFTNQMVNIGYSFHVSQMAGLGSQSVMSNGASAPSLPTFKGAPDVNATQQASADTIAKKEVATTVSLVGAVTQKIYSSLQASPPSDVTSLVQELNSSLTADYKSGGKYYPATNTSYYTTDQLITIFSAIAVDTALTNRPNLNYTELITAVNEDTMVKKYKAVNDTNQLVEDDNKNVQEAAGNNVFSNWLENVKYKEVCPECTDYNLWLENSKIGDFQLYQAEWKRAFPSASTVQQKMAAIKKTVRLNSTSTSKGLFINGAEPVNDVDPVVIGFSLMPWSSIFPELITVPVDDSSNLIVLGILGRISDYLNDYNYYGLTLKYQPSSLQAYDPYLGDMTTTNNDLKSLITSLMNAYFSDNKQVYFNGQYYKLDSSDSIIALRNAIDAYLANTKLRSSDWYKAILPLKEKGLISPLGNLLVTTDSVGSLSDFDKATYMSLVEQNHAQSGLGVLSSSQHLASNQVPYLKNVLSLPDQIINSANKAENHQTVAVVLPLVYKSKSNGKYYEDFIFASQVADSSGSAFSASFMRTNDSYGVQTQISLSTPALDISRLNAGYPVVESLSSQNNVNTLCKTGDLPNARTIWPLAGYGFPTYHTDYRVRKTPGIYTDSQTKHVFYTEGIATLVLGSPCDVHSAPSGYQSLLIFPITSSLINQIAGKVSSSPTPPLLRNFYIDNNNSLGTLKQSLGI